MNSTICQFHVLDVIALKDALPDHHLHSGQVGTLVEQLTPDVYEVEFSDDNGQTYALLPLHTSQLLKLHYTAITSQEPMSNTIHQYGSRDNFAGDQVHGDKIGTQINHSQNLTEAAQEIKQLLEQLDQDYDRTTPTGQAMIGAKAVEAIDKNPTLKARVVNALKEGGTTALESAIDHPAVKPVVAMLKGFMDAK
jgi:hypothetical protein